MDVIWSRTIKAMAAVGGAIAGAFGGWDKLLQVLAVMMAADYVSGLVVAAMGKSQKTDWGGLSSKVGAIGLAKKGLMLLVVLIATSLDKAMGNATWIVRDMACWFYIANEGLSLLENLDLAGVPFPAAVKKILGTKKQEAEAMQDENNDKQSTDTPAE